MDINGLNPEDFKRLPEDGAQFEALVCHLLEGMGFRILEKPAVGTEGGRDVLVERTLKDVMGEKKERVVVQCKHHAHSGKAVGDSHVGIWENAMKRHKARGYLLVTDTRVTENLSKSFRAYSEDEANLQNWAHFWDVDDLIRNLNDYPSVRNSFFPPKPVARTPLENLADEVRIWLTAIRYDVSEPNASSAKTLDMVAVLNQGTIKQTIMVRCIGGEITSSSVNELNKSLSITTPQGWLISDRRISERARTQATKLGTVQVFTLSALLQQVIWGPYFESLTSSYESEKLGTRYVDGGCHKIEVDDDGNEIARDAYESVNAYVDDWLDERGKMHVSLLGDFGSGKTWFCLQYAYRQFCKFLNNPSKERLPLLINLRLFAKAMTAQQLVNHVLLEHYKLPFIGSAYEVIQEMNRRGKLLLILDGFDEMARKVDYQTVVDNFWQLAKLVEEEGKVILTSRTEYFRWARESDKVLGGEEYGRETLVLEPPKFDVIYLDSFNEEQIENVIVQRYGEEKGQPTARTILNSPTLSEMARKPLMIELLLAALDEVSAEVLDAQAVVFLYATNRLLLRNILAEKTFTSTADKLYFLCELAWEMIKSSELRIHYKLVPEKIKSYFGEKVKDDHELDTWDYDLRSQTLLHRDSAGYYEFAHKSLAEYFVALKFALELNCLSPIFLETYCEADSQPCKNFIGEKDLSSLTDSFGAQPFDYSMNTILKLLSEMLSDDAGQKLWELVYETRGKTREQVKYLGSNALAVLSEVGEEFIAKDLSELMLPRLNLLGANLASTNLTGTTLTESNLRYCNLSKALCTNTNFDAARLSNAVMHNTVFEKSSFKKADVNYNYSILAVALHPNGRYVAADNQLFDIAIWDIETGKMLNPIKGKSGSVQGIQFNPQGNLLAYGGGDGYLAVYDVENSKVVWMEKVNSDMLRGLSFNGTGQLLGSVGEDPLLVVHEVCTGNRLFEIETEDELMCITFSPDDKYVAAGSNRGKVIVWDLSTKKECFKAKICNDNVHFVTFSADSKNFIAGGTTYRVRKTKHGATEKGGTAKIYREKFSTVVWGVNEWHVKRKFESTASGGWNRGSVSPVNPHIIQRDGQTDIVMLNYESGKEILRLLGHQGTVFNAVFDSSGLRIATSSNDGTIRIWDSITGSEKIRLAVEMCRGATFYNSIGLSSPTIKLLKERGARVLPDNSVPS